MMLMMPIDTGNKVIKTEHFEFHSGISVLEDVTGEGEEAVKCQGLNTAFLLLKTNSSSLDMV